MKNLLLIGQFAKLTRLTVKTLRYYDRIELLVPAHVDSDSGFRYYRIVQAAEAEQIRLLRGLDMSIEQVRRIVGERDTARVRGELSAHKARIAEKLAESQRILTYLERLLDKQEPSMRYPISIKEAAAQPILSVRKQTDLVAIGRAIHEGIGELFAYASHVGVAPAGPPGTIYLDEDIEREEGLDIEVFLPVARNTAGDTSVRGRVLEAAKVATTLHAGAFHEVGPAYTAMFAWIHEQGHAVAGPPREIYLRKGDLPDDNRVEISWPIRDSLV